MINHARFWHVIETCGQAARQDVFRFLVAWESQLRAMTPNDALMTVEGLHEACGRMVSWETFTVAWIVTGGSRDDFYPRILELVVAHGQNECDLFRRHADHYAGMKRLRGRWNECGLGATGRHVLATRPDRSTLSGAVPVPLDLWSLIFRKLGVAMPEGGNARAMTETLKAHCPYPPETWARSFPAAVAMAQANAISPAYDRRTPMDETKFWHVLHECQGLAQPWQFLPGLLATLPQGQSTDFAMTAFTLVDEANQSLRNHPDYAPWVAWWALTQGRELFYATVEECKDGISLAGRANEDEGRTFQQCIQTLAVVPARAS
jgi:hypothetical protein